MVPLKFSSRGPLTDHSWTPISFVDGDFAEAHEVFSSGKVVAPAANIADFFKNSLRVSMMIPVR